VLARAFEKCCNNAPTGAVLFPLSTRCKSAPDGLAAFGVTALRCAGSVRDAFITVQAAKGAFVDLYNTPWHGFSCCGLYIGAGGFPADFLVETQFVIGKCALCFQDVTNARTHLRAIHVAAIKQKCQTVLEPYFLSPMTGTDGESCRQSCIE